MDDAEKQDGDSAPAEERSSGEGSRREFMRQSGMLTASALIGLVPPGVRQAAWAAGTDAPEKPEVRIGFLPLSDCASVVMAAELGLDRKYGLKILPIRTASWASVRDRLLAGELDAAQALYGLIYGVQMGIGGTRRDMAVLMTLNANGQGITLSRRLADEGVINGASLARLVHRRERSLVFAQTFPTGTHALWLYHWLAGHGIHPLRDVSITVVPPPQMVRNLQACSIDGCCVGEPWNARAADEGIGFTVATSQDVWPDHPEKVLGATRDFVERYPNTARAMVMAMLDAGRWIDASEANREHAARTIASDPYVGVPVALILDRMLGRYHDGMGRSWTDASPMKFFAEGSVNFPYLSDGMWFLTQFRRWGLIDAPPEYEKVAAGVNRIDLYREAAQALGVPLPAQPVRTARFFDGTIWSGQDPERYALGHPVHA